MVGEEISRSPSQKNTQFTPNEGGANGDIADTLYQNTKISSSNVFVRQLQSNEMGTSAMV